MYFLAWGLLVSLTSLSSFTSPCWADEVYTFVIKKQSDKEQNRWSLSDWLDTRDRMRVQDLWLALHSSTPYEFNVGANYQFNQVIGGGSFNATDVYGSAFASIFGLELHYLSGIDHEFSGMFDLRIFGLHDQATNITLQAGVRSVTGSSANVTQPLGGLSLTFYLARFFGIEGLYRHYFSSASSNSSVNVSGSVSGDRFQGGAFIDFSFVRVYGDYYSSSETVNSSNGIILGTKIFF
jgi:hypothetical protein